jgi:acyl-CoA synthetase (AMP-forming)/AMP-acid ligase II
MSVSHCAIIAALVDSLPRNPNGKILTRELRAQYVQAVAAQSEVR